MSSEQSPEVLEPSALGNKDYWDRAYVNELHNFESNPEDEGTIWFADSDAEDKILAFLTEEEALPPSTSFLDLGTGNGHLLFLLRDEGDFDGGRLVGVDYSAESVRLARSIAKERGLGDEDVRFERWDIIKEQPGDWVEDGFDVVLDKGTFDAISLSEEADATGERIFKGFPGRVQGLVKPGGLLLITSCNWTEAELRGWFEGGELEYHATIKYPSFTFGGQQGQTISSVCFHRKC